MIVALVEGVGVNAAPGLTGVSKPTILKLPSDLGTACTDFHDRHLGGLSSERIQTDQIWSLNYCKQKNIPAATADPSRRGAEKPPKDKNQKTVATKGPIGMVRDMDIPLQNGGIATFPVPMTPADHRLLKTILDGPNPIHVQEIPTEKVAEDDRAATKH